MIRVDHVKSDVAFDDFRHQGIDCAAGGGNRMKNMRTLGACLERLFDGLNLSAYAADTIQQFVLVSKDVCQGLLQLSQRIVYPGRYSVKLTFAYLIATTIESGPIKCSTRVSRKPASFIQPMQSAPV